MSINEFGVDLWIELIISNELENQDIFNLATTCKFFSHLLKNEKIHRFLEDRKIQFGTYKNTEMVLVTTLAWSHDNRAIALADVVGKIFIWNTKTAKSSKISNDSLFSSCTHSLDFHPYDANLLATSHNLGLIYLWNIEKRQTQRKFVGHANSVYCVAFHPRGQHLVSGGWDHTIRIWNVENEKCEKIIDQTQSSIVSVMFTPDGKYLGASTFDDSCVYIWNFETFQCVQKLCETKNSFTPSCFQFFTDNKTLAVENSKHSFVEFYDFLSGDTKPEMRFQTENRHHSSICLHPNQKLLVLGGINGLEFWDIEQKKLLSKENCGSVKAMSLSPNGRALAFFMNYEHWQILNVQKYL